MFIKGYIFQLMIKSLELSWYTSAKHLVPFILEREGKASGTSGWLPSVSHRLFPLYKPGEKSALSQVSFSRQHDPWAFLKSLVFNSTFQLPKIAELWRRTMIYVTPFFFQFSWKGWRSLHREVSANTKNVATAASPGHLCAPRLASRSCCGRKVE